MFAGFFTRTPVTPTPEPEPALTPEQQARMDRFNTWGVTR